MLGAKATVADLGRVDWRALRARWGRSDADWNHLRRAVSSFLTVLLDGKHHQFRHEVMRRIPKADEGEGRVPALTPEQFWQIVASAPEHARAAYVVLAAPLQVLGRLCSEPIVRDGKPVLTKRGKPKLGWHYAGLALHDLRHRHGQWATDEGAPESKVQAALRHASPIMTRPYVLKKDRGEVGRMVGRALGSGRRRTG